LKVDLRAPRFSGRFVHVWRRNALVWRKMMWPSLLANLGDPLIYLIGLGYGLGMLVPDVGGIPYITFLAGGSIAFSTMNSATFEAFYSAFSRMHVQKTWDAILYAPLDLDDIIAGEAMFAATKATVAGAAILLVATLLGVTHSPLAVAILLVLPVIGLCFAALGLVITAVARSYDFFSYYFTLVVTPMAMMSGVFFPLDQLPAALRTVAACLPLSHAVAITRGLVTGNVPDGWGWSIVVLLVYTVAGFYAAVVLLRRRLAN